LLEVFGIVLSPADLDESFTERAAILIL
jgi:hypothetical protein